MQVPGCLLVADTSHQRMAGRSLRHPHPEIGCGVEPPPPVRWRAGEIDMRQPEVGTALAERHHRAAGLEVTGEYRLLRDHALRRRAARDPENVVGAQDVAELFRRADDVEYPGVARPLKAADMIIGAGGWRDDAPPSSSCFVA